MGDSYKIPASVGRSGSRYEPVWLTGQLVERVDVAVLAGLDVDVMPRSSDGHVTQAPVPGAVVVPDVVGRALEVPQHVAVARVQPEHRCGEQVGARPYRPVIVRTGLRSGHDDYPSLLVDRIEAPDTARANVELYLSCLRIDPVVLEEGLYGWIADYLSARHALYVTPVAVLEREGRIAEWSFGCGQG